MKKHNRFFKGSISGRIIRITTDETELRPEIVDELIDIYNELPATLQVLPVVIDLARIESLTLQQRNVYRIVSLLQEKGPERYPRMVAITDCDVMFGMVRMLQMLWDNNLFQVVRTEEEAMTFIHAK